MHAHAADPLVLAHCAAIVVGHDDGDCRALIEIGEAVGFGAVADFAHFGHNDWQAHPLLFFLVHYGIGLAAKRALLERVRHAASVNICFAPVVLFLQDGPPGAVRDYREMGFDDVIELPEDSHVLSTRLATQFGREHVYIETRDYIGPERWRGEIATGTPPGPGRQHDHANLTVWRSPAHGVQILRRQTVRAH